MTVLSASQNDLNRIRIAVAQGGRRLLALQRHDPGWEGAWRKYVGSQRNSSQSTGLAALGLLDAYRATGDESFLAGVLLAQSFIFHHVGVGADGELYRPRLTAAEVVLLHRLAEETRDERLSRRALAEWKHIRNYFYFVSPAELDAYYRKVERRCGFWDMAQYFEAADLSADPGWADAAAAVLARTRDEYCLSIANPHRLLNLASALGALSAHGYGVIYKAEIGELAASLIEALQAKHMLGVQEAACAAMALLAAGGQHRWISNALLTWLVDRQTDWGGWLEQGVQYPHIDAEAIRPLVVLMSKRPKADTPVDGGMLWTIANHDKSQWRAVGSPDPATPFDGD